MGMDVYGVKPSSSVGEYFRASIWQWRPIHERMAVLCGDILDDNLLDAMTCNEGVGPKNQETCTKIADRFEVWLEGDPREKFSLLDDRASILVTEDGRFVSERERVENPNLVTKSPYSVGREELREFIEFLRSCGGFCVW